MDLLRALPIGLYLEQPRTWLHQLDPRVKLAWLMMFLLTPLLADLPWRMALALGLVFLTVSAAIPLRVWRKQIGWLTLLCILVVGVTALMPDGLAISYQPRLPTHELVFAQDALPTQTFQATPYQYVLFHYGPVRITRRSLELGLRLGSWFFTLIYGTALYLLTTAPEEIAIAIEHLLQPLRRWRFPITEITLTLTLSLRFIPLVLEEIQNLTRSIRTRAINWKKLGIRGVPQLLLLLADRLIENLFLRAEQVASAMTVRGFTSPNNHQVRWHQLKIRTGDWFALALVILICGVRIWVGTLP
ncbi:CbiQ family ECF transporter T component [Acaryochloris sp. IP29b_bin.137]|uniref:energy-coupling factor transporter transmembrane component T family protein n=1 Tax=Acaryochloris sp. IP29b_bin.137 TaxID=2969217 RepID=UPI002634873E|nr:CbiQ family ECF transporter T component [Acaryochloris sp. IP29b_bin.137]